MRLHLVVLTGDVARAEEKDLLAATPVSQKRYHDIWF
jgi:hypothetical protein